MKTAVVVLPTYNEAENIGPFLDAVFAVAQKLDNWDLHAVVVDSSSPDGTAAVVREKQKEYKKLHLLETPKEGLGKAYVAGFRYAVDELKAYAVIQMDSDFQHEPKKIPDLLAAIANGADFALGSRYMKGGSIPASWGIERKFFSIIGNLIIRLGFMKLSITDWTGGFRAVKSWVVRESLPHLSKYTGYVFQVAFLDSALKQNAVVSEVPIHFGERTAGESKINTGQFTFETLWYVFTHSSFVRFVIVGLSGFVVDIGVTAVLHLTFDFAVWFATFFSGEAAIVNNYIWNNFWSFSHRRLKGGFSAHIAPFLKFNLVSIGNVLIQAGLLWSYEQFFGESYLILVKVVIIAFIIIPYSYILYNKLIWKKK